MKVRCDGCEKTFQAAFAPCPDGREGCLVAHYNKESWICPHCGFDMGPAVAKSVMEGPHTMEIGMGVGNLAAIQRLEIYNTPRKGPNVLVEKFREASKKDLTLDPEQPTIRGLVVDQIVFPGDDEPGF